MIVNIETCGGEPIPLEGLSPPHPDTPAPRPYRFNAETLRDLATGIRLNMNVLITGPVGCGKTSLPIALAARLGRPVIRFNLNGETRVSGLIGSQRPVSVDGVLTLRFDYGALVTGLRGGYWIVLDEIDAAPAGVLMVLQPVLEEGARRLHVPETGECFAAHPNTRIFATGNTLGYRAAKRVAHAGTHMVNQAFVDRFGMVLAADYPNRIEEIERVRANAPHVNADFVDGICRVAESLRKDTSFRSDFSTRRLIQWGRLLAEYQVPDKPGVFDVLRTFELACGRKMESATDLKIAREVVRRIFGYSEQDERCGGGAAEPGATVTGRVSRGA